MNIKVITMKKIIRSKILTLTILMIIFVFIGFGCKTEGVDDSSGAIASGSASIELFGIYGSGVPDPEYRLSFASEEESYSNATVEVYEMDENGDITIVAGSDGSITTNSDGTFTTKIPEGNKSFIIKIKNKNGEKKCFFQRNGNSSDDDKKDFAIVDSESDVEAEMIQNDVSEKFNGPDNIDREDIDDLIDKDIAELILNEKTIKKCIIDHIRNARNLTYKMFLDSLKDKNLSDEEISDIDNKFKQINSQTRTLRKELRKNIYEAILQNSSNIDKIIEDILKEHRENVQNVIIDVGIPPELYLKAKHIAATNFENAILHAYSTCENFPLEIIYRTMKRALVRKIRDDKMQTKYILKKVFAYTQGEKIDAGYEIFKNTIKGLKPDVDTRVDIGNAIKLFYDNLMQNIKLAVDDSIVTDMAIDNVIKALFDQKQILNDALTAATTENDRKLAYTNFNIALKNIANTEFDLNPQNNTPDILKKKITILELIFVLQT